jgi:S-DNA-T family DNA segregation ATPase FtsK/SpoIIIE
MELSPTTETPREPVSLRSRLGLGVLLLASVLMVLALVSYRPDDADRLLGGLSDQVPVQNLVGYLGAYVAHGMVMCLGLGAYVFAFLVLVCSARRLLRIGGIRPVRWEYWLAVLLTTLGSSMLAGTRGGTLSPLASRLNIQDTLGGAVGQILCGPEHGCIWFLLNPTGSVIVAAALVLGGVSVVFVYDWLPAVVLVWQRLRAGRADAGSAGVAPRKEKPPRPPKEKRARRPKPSPEPAAMPVEPPAPLPTPERRTPARTRERPTGALKGSYRLPGLELLNPAVESGTGADPEEVTLKQQVLQDTLDSFGIEAKVIGATSGPRVTLVEVQPAPGVKVERISQISRNIAMNLRAVSLRILAPIPGRNSVGIEVPNVTPVTVSLRGLMETQEWRKTRARIPLLLGRNIKGDVVILDLARAPHLLIAGATGSGKSVCMNTMIMSMLYRFPPEDLRMIMVDPKVVEFSCYETLPHLVVPVVHDADKVILALRWVIREMEKRYRIMAKAGVRNLEGYNARKRSPEPVLDDAGNPIPDKMPYIVLIVDELADIMMTAKSDVETALARIAQLSRAVGIHTIIATQRPSVNVITGTIKANFPTRIAFQVTSQVDSRTILDGKGAESLLGRGDMLYRPPGASAVERNQGALVEDSEIDSAVAHCAEQAEQEFDEEVFRSADEAGAMGGAPGEVAEADEELVEKAIDIILRDRRATTSYVQRCLRIGYNRAALIMEVLEQRGVVGPQIGSAPREILILDQNDGDTDDD